ncbi:MAG: ABC transporter substrate-binding protein [Solirubrobacterales bacterium]
MRALLVTALIALAIGGCGGSSDSPSGGAVPGAGHGGTLEWALADRPSDLDPLFADSPSEKLVSRQIHEPLVEEVGGPYDDPRRLPGIALAVHPSSDDLVWRIRLRPGVRFQDGTLCDAAAVIANAQRWQALSARSGIAPEPALFVFSPRPGEVTFKLAAPDPRFDRRLASPRLGLVSPRALRQAAGSPLDPSQVTGSGTGPFELRERGADRLVLARNADWWGTDRGLGPAIDQLEMPVVADPDERLADLRSGEIEAAGELPAGEARRLRRDPLLSAIPDGYGTVTGVERSVRGIPPGIPAPSLNGTWLTRISPG